ncbi:helix-turn-helix domain-containing protein [Pseudomonas gessardii]|nr:helix-turn-helix domain-containing protein [Pseudomonas gessardii]
MLTAKALSSEGLSARRIAQAMGVSNRTVSLWLKQTV